MKSFYVKQTTRNSRHGSSSWGTGHVCSTYSEPVDSLFFAIVLYFVYLITFDTAIWNLSIRYE